MSNNLPEVICKALDDKKGENIQVIDLREVEGAICDYFVVTNADSSVQVGALADNVEKECFEKLREKVIRVQGLENSLWVAMDYGEVMVHIFQSEMRDYYRLEELWSDAPISRYESSES
ncbi:MAG: ribosome silencing factor [Rikenellaceae bacterium]